QVRRRRVLALRPDAELQAHAEEVIWLPPARAACNRGPRGARMNARILAAPISVALISLLAAACSAKAGDDCSIGKHVRLDKGTMLACNTGRYVAVPCKGPGGCVDPGSSPICDFSHDEGGGECPDTLEGKSHCTPDGKSQISCVKGKFLIEPCRGTGNCAE